MGNCLERSRRGRCGGGGGAATHYAKTSAVWVEEEVGRKEEEEARKGESAPAAGATEVKIRITRKQLEELLRRVEGGKGSGDGVPVRDVVSELLVVASTSSNFRHREEVQWRPSLQSIPE
ncbi:hypothetical protein PAHAL_2G388900 [Panicum hallii]|jgi:hypothetical protein|uniref:Uncharacterized protein n=1 Tax=Panicum hallii TaxID=206008 RepID=A0A2S3H2Q8_9POAL|nr:uncharacterized protein LOC112882726 [Panicum hallii]PAN14175.1 hypothetical protein PAHAL_2G388900 [Panicum hallii]